MKLKKEGNIIKKGFKKFWWLLWEDDSLKGWIFSIMFLFVFVKFIFFPAASFITGTELPLAIVESCSMYHHGNVFSNFNGWWEKHESKYSALNINETTFKSFSMKRGFSKGDILFLIGIKAEKLKVGDVILFEAGQKNPVIHRIINIRQENGKYFFSTYGDNNNGQLSFEKDITEEKIIGRAVFRIVPYLGWMKLIFFENSRPQEERGLCKET